MKLRHPNLPDHQVIEIPDDEDTAAVHEEAGWVRIPDPVQVNSALAAGEVETKTDDDLEVLRVEYRDRFGEDPDGRWGAQRLRDELATDDADEKAGQGEADT